MTRYYSAGFNGDDYDGEPDPRALADRLPRRDVNGLIDSTPHARPVSRSIDRPIPGKIEDPEAAAPLRDLFGIAAQDGDLYRRDLDSLVWADDVSESKRAQLRDEIRERYHEIRQLRREGAMADARALARVAAAEFAGYLDAPRRADAYDGYDERQLADLIPRSGVPTRDLPPRSA